MVPPQTALRSHCYCTQGCMIKTARFIILVRDLYFFYCLILQFSVYLIVESRQQVHLPDLQIHL